MTGFHITGLLVLLPESHYCNNNNVRDQRIMQNIIRNSGGCCCWHFSVTHILEEAAASIFTLTSCTVKMEVSILSDNY